MRREARSGTRAIFGKKSRTAARFCSGFTLVEVIVGIALMLVLFLALFGVLRASLILSTFTKTEAAATELASSQMEYLRGLSYDAIGTAGGIPAGNIPQTATTTVDGMPYAIRTFVTYYDDPADGVGAADTNGVTTDYKIGKVTVSYTVDGIRKSISLLSKFVPPGIESSTGGGTLSLHIVDAQGNGVNDALVEIKNDETTPTVDFTTFSNTSGYVVTGGAATSTAYQVFVSKSGYSSAQTYARTNENVNPTPGYLTVVANETTAATFSIDRLATLTLSLISPVSVSTWQDAFADASRLAAQNGTYAGGGALTLASGQTNGSARSISISAGYLEGWGMLSATIATSSGTTASVHVDDGSGTPLPDSVLPGNSTGFSSFPVSLVGISTTTYPSLSLEASLASDSTTTTPVLSNWSLSYSSGPSPLLNAPFTLTGTKAIGTTASGTPIYKNIINGTSGGTGSVTENLEWDSYTATSTPAVIRSCPLSFDLAPGTSTSATLLSGSIQGNTFTATIVDSSGNPVAGAGVSIASATYAETAPTSACGIAYFNAVPQGTYAATVSLPGYASKTVPGIVVSGMASTTISFP